MPEPVQAKQVQRAMQVNIDAKAAMEIECAWNVAVATDLCNLDVDSFRDLSLQQDGSSTAQ